MRQVLTLCEVYPECLKEMAFFICKSIECILETITSSSSCRFASEKNPLVTFLPWLRAFLIKQINFQRSNAIHGQHPFIFDRNIIAYEYYFTTKGRYLLSTYKSLSFTFSLAHLSYEWSKIRNIQFEVINANLSLSHSFVLRFCNFIQLYWKDENLENPHMFENLTH